MTHSTISSQTADLAPEDYCVLGLATCFIRDEGEVQQLKILEPIPSAALEALMKNIPTSYESACAKTLSEILEGDRVIIPPELQTEEQINLCDRFTERLAAAIRTYKIRPEAKTHIPLGSTKQDFNYSIERKRVLNNSRVVKTEDNIKQHSHTHKVL